MSILPTPNSRKHNFSAGPGALPFEVLEEIARELPDFRGLGISIMEMSHRSKEFEGVVADTRAALTRLLGLGSDYEILLIQGGASQQFAMVPMNLGPGGVYLNTGEWASKAVEEAQRWGETFEAYSGKAENFSDLPGEERRFDGPVGAKYLHYTSNNTLYGTQFHHLPRTNLPLVCDVSSDFISRPVDMTRFDLVYAGAQKNAGPSGVTIVVAKRDVLRTFKGDSRVPTIFRYQTHAENETMYNTPNCFGIWVVGLMARWVERQGGVAAMEVLGREKADLIYSAIDERPDFYRGHAVKAVRSLMNITFRCATEALDEAFMAEADRRGLISLKGHRKVGGMRASIYNAVPKESVAALADLIRTFGR